MDNVYFVPAALYSRLLDMKAAIDLVFEIYAKACISRVAPIPGLIIATVRPISVEDMKALGIVEWN